MVFNNLKIINRSDPVNIQIVGEQIALLTPHAIPKTLDFSQVTFENALVFPGLINSHDHLDFNLFPQLGNRIYNDYTEWGHDIHIQNKATISRILQVPEELRVQLGIYKNLINGVTTVVNHGQRLKTESNLISIFQNCDSLHSVKFEKNWKWKINRRGKSLPVVIHTGEGTNRSSYDEIEELITWNILKRKLIAIHGVAMSERQAKAFLALIWCPVSNYFLLNKTADVKRLKTETRMLFGTDSTLTASWNLWIHLRLAMKSGMVNESELYDMLTRSPARVWGLKGKGCIDENCMADLVIAKSKSSQTNWADFYALNPEDMLLVVHQGRIRLFDASLYGQLCNANINPDGYSKFFVNDICKYIKGDFPGLIAKIKLHYPDVSLPFFADEPSYKDILNH